MSRKFSVTVVQRFRPIPRSVTGCPYAAPGRLWLAHSSAAHAAIERRIWSYTASVIISPLFSSFCSGIRDELNVICGIPPDFS